jgi:RecA-family ATPase
MEGRDIRPALIAIEAAADVLAGNENDRSQVRQFIGLLRRLALNTGAAVVLIQHPSLTGSNTGTGTSGSTGWNNSARSRLYFTPAKRREGDDADPDGRELRVMKSNYGPAGEVVRLRWQRGVFVPEGSVASPDRVAGAAHVDQIFLRCLDLRTASGINVTPHPGRSYAPADFVKMQEANGCKSPALARAMERLLSSQRIRVETYGPPSKQRSRLIAVAPETSADA